MTCTLKIVKPHVIDMRDSDKARVQKLNRNFNDTWQEFVDAKAVFTDLCGRVSTLESRVGSASPAAPAAPFKLREGWDDLRVPLVGVQQGGVKDPDFVQVKDDGSGSTGVYAWGFDSGSEEELFFAVQMPHSWKQGTPIRPHIHWSPSNTNTGSVSWGLEYTLSEINSAFGNTTILDVQQAGSGTAYQHQIAAWDEIDMSGIDSVSAMILCRVFRDAGGALGTDDYNADAIGLEVDFHYLRNDLGSRAEYVK